LVLVVYVCFNFALIRKFNEKRGKRNKVCKHFRRKSEKMTVRDERKSFEDYYARLSLENSNFAENMDYNNAKYRVS
jgi:hypothetical protein